VVTKLHGALRREISIQGRAYVVALDATGIKLTLKGHRKGQEISWTDFVSGDAALAAALSASLAQANDESVPAPRVRGKAAKQKTSARRHSR